MNFSRATPPSLLAPEAGRAILVGAYFANYRALAARRGDSFYWFWIGSHADYERLLAQL